MTHDPLCPSVTACNCRHDECCFCDSEVWCMCRLIEKVRADERSKHEAEIERIYESWSVDVDHQRYH